MRYETKPSLIGHKVEISYDPAAPETITVSYPGYEPFTAQPIRIGEYCDKRPALPASMQKQKPSTSRFLDALETAMHRHSVRWLTQSHLHPIGRRRVTMYEAFFCMEHTPFVRDVPPEKLYESSAFRETLGRLSYVADRQMFAVVTADSGCGKSTLIRRFYSELPKEDYIVLYLSDSKLTPRWFYKGLLDQLGLESRFYRGDSKRQLQQEIEIIRGVQHKKVVCILDEAHLLEKET